MNAFPPAYLRDRLAALGCDAARIEESFIHSGGAGGQNVNKVATCVQLRYAPENLQVKMQEHRTQAANRIAAWNLIVTQLGQLRERAARERRAARELKRRQNAPRPRGVKKAFVELKRRRAQRRSERRHSGED